jgi:hypothetical protein
MAIGRPPGGDRRGSLLGYLIMRDDRKGQNTPVREGDEERIKSIKSLRGAWSDGVRPRGERMI